MTTGAPSAPATDRATVARLLRTDPVWSAYALGDLDARRAHHCEWIVRDESLVLLYREFGAPILFAMGDPAILDALPPIDRCHLQIPEAFLPALERRLTVRWTCLMHRMALDPGTFVDVRGLVAPEPLDASHDETSCGRCLPRAKRAARRRTSS
jgi:hypothetical protein